MRAKLLKFENGVDERVHSLSNLESFAVENVKLKSISKSLESTVRRDLNTMNTKARRHKENNQEIHLLPFFVSHLLCAFVPSCSLCLKHILGK